jgi:PRC-barrel domain
MLHKTSYMRGFHIQATDGGIGHVDEFLVDESWNVRYLVVDTSNWIGGKSVLVPSSAVEKVDSPHKKIFIKLTREEVKTCADVETADIALIETLGPTIL